MTGAGEAVAAVVVLVRMAPSCEAGAASEEVGAGPRHSGFLFMAHSADLEFTRGDNSKGENVVGGSHVPHVGAGDLLLHQDELLCPDLLTQTQTMLDQTDAQ